MQTRRSFLKQSGRIAALSALSGAVYQSALADFRTSPSDQLRVGLIGCRGMGWNNLRSFLKNPGVVVAALCDIDESVLQMRKAELEKEGTSVRLHTDYKKLYDDKEVDIVIIATPDHWHCLQMIDACHAGKDVYVEKPLANSIAECRSMVDAVHKTRRIVQVNQWQRSQAHFNDAIKFVHSGALGKIVMVKSWMHRTNSQPLPIVGDEPVPAGVNYDAWLGPAKKRTFNKNRFHYEFRWFWDYAGGLMTDWGVHLLDIALWGMKCKHPDHVSSSGGKYVFPEDARETPDTQNVLYKYPNFDLTWEHTLAGGRGYYDQSHGIAFVGFNGTLVVTRRGWQVIPEKGRMEAIEWKPSSDSGLDLHVINFLEAVKSRNAGILNCPVEVGSMAAEISHMGNVAYRTGETIHWRHEQNRFAEKDARNMIEPKYHNGYKMP